MPRAFAIPLPVLLSTALVLGAGLSVHAQRGGGFHSGGGFHASGGGFHSGGGFNSGGMSGGGFASHSAPARSFGGFSGVRPSGPARFGAPTHLSGPMRYQPGRPFGPSSNLRMRAPGGFRPNPGSRRPEYDARRPQYPVSGHPGYDHRHHPHWPQYNYGGTTYYTGTLLPYGYPYYGYGLGYGDLDFPYDDSYDSGSGYYDQNSYYQGDAQGYDNGGAYNDGNNYVADSAPEAAEPQPYNRYSSPNPPVAAQQSSPLPPQESVTLIFNNGAPSQQIHNYILSRNTLTVLDGPHREIPLSTLDLAATEQANRSAGVDFHLPQ
ncbi:MAG TPA: hypothetical protein VIM62_08180 [Acidobacteriaceae bacterium]